MKAFFEWEMNFILMWIIGAWTVVLVIGAVYVCVYLPMLYISNLFYIVSSKLREIKESRR